MNYELAKQLKDAGFPQTGDNQNGYANDGGYEPLLSELIEACGDKFMDLHYFSDTKTWLAVSDENTTARSSTPEEAVANLWLALNKKD